MEQMWSIMHNTGCKPTASSRPGNGDKCDSYIAELRDGDICYAHSVTSVSITPYKYSFTTTTTTITALTGFDLLDLL